MITSVLLKMASKLLLRLSSLTLDGSSNSFDVIFDRTRLCTEVSVKPKGFTENGFNGQVSTSYLMHHFPRQIYVDKKARLLFSLSFIHLSVKAVIINSLVSLGSKVGQRHIK